MLLQSPVGFEPDESLPQLGAALATCVWGLFHTTILQNSVFVDWIGFEPMVLPEWEQFYRLSASTACIPIQICFLGGFSTTGLPASFVQTLGLNNITIERQLHYSNHSFCFS